MIVALFLLLIALGRIKGTNPLVIHNLSVLNPHVVRADGLAPWTQAIRMRGLEGSGCADSSVSLGIADETGEFSIDHAGRGFAGVFRFLNAGMMTILYPQDNNKEEQGDTALALQENDVVFAVLPHVDDFQMGPLDMHSFMISAAFQSNLGNGRHGHGAFPDTRATVVVGMVGRRDAAMTTSRSYKVLYSREWESEYSPIDYERPVCCCSNGSAAMSSGVPPEFYSSVDLQDPSLHPSIFDSRLNSGYHSSLLASTMPVEVERTTSPVWGLTSPSFNWPTPSPYTSFLRTSNSLGSSFWAPTSSDGAFRKDAATPVEMAGLQLPAGAMTPATGVLPSPSSPVLYPSSANTAEQALEEVQPVSRRSVRLLSLHEYRLEQEYNAARRPQSPPVDMKAPPSGKRKSSRRVPTPRMAKRPRQSSSKK